MFHISIEATVRDQHGNVVGRKLIEGANNTAAQRNFVDHRLNDLQAALTAESDRLNGVS